MDSGLRWVAALGLGLLWAGLVALAVPSPYEGPVVYILDAQHALRTLDLLGAFLISSALCMVWAVGLAWQRRNTAAARAYTWPPKQRHWD